MSQDDSEVPERLHVVGGTELEQRLVQAAGREQPSPELSERMARAIGIAAPFAGGGPDVSTNAPQPVPAPAAGIVSRSLLPWISGGVVALVVAAGFVAMQPQTAPSEVPAEPTGAAAVPVAPTVPEPQPAEFPPARVAPTADEAARPATATSASRARVAPSAATGDLSEQIALVDDARAALASGAADRALASARDYQARYPSGTFRPEVTAIKIEALAKSGRTSEARTQAERFVATYGPGPLADRVRRVSGLGRP
jgi:hypothetical protein